ncbi:putative antitoxin of bacterial toxin-antitoxin system, YdaS/YdaT [compost metagenome]
MELITPVDALKCAVDKAGGQSALADALSKLSEARGGESISPARVWNWVNRDKRAPSDVCPDIEVLTDVKCEVLRPDVNWAAIRNKPRKSKPLKGDADQPKAPAETGGFAINSEAKEL